MAAAVVIDAATAQQVVLALQAQGRRIVTFVGYSGLGYENEKALRAHVQTALANLDPREHCIASGATATGIGVVYELAKRQGFATLGIVSSQAKNEVLLASCVDQVFFVHDAQWGGYLPGNAALSPTSQAIVASSAAFIAIGGGEIARDELLEAKRLNKPVTFIPADMNHQLMREKAAATGQPQPTDFRGAAHLALMGE